MRFYANPRLSTAKPFPNLVYLEIAHLFKINPKTVREEWDLVDIYEMLAFHRAKELAQADIAKNNKVSRSEVFLPYYCPIRKSE